MRRSGLSGDVRDYAADPGRAAGSRSDKLGPLDIVVSGAAGNFLAPALGMSANALPHRGRYRPERHLQRLPRLPTICCNRPGASLIAITAGQAVNPLRFQAHVCAAKAGINQLIRVSRARMGVPACA